MELMTCTSQSSIRQARRLCWRAGADGIIDLFLYFFFPCEREKE